MAQPDAETWQGTPLEMELGLDPYGIKEIVMEFDTGEEEVMRPKLREEFGSYELHMMSAYLDSIAHRIRKGHKN